MITKNHPSAYAELFAKAKQNEIHTCLDTSGFVDIDKLDPILDNTDLVLLDLKHMFKTKLSTFMSPSLRFPFLSSLFCDLFTWPE